MRNLLLNINQKVLTSPVAWFGNVISTIFSVGIFLLLYSTWAKVDIAEITNVFELFKQVWWVVLLGFIIKFSLAYLGQDKRGFKSYWFGLFPELVLYFLTFVVILLTGNYGA